uniref:SCP domain-containing protein n=1 Tax=Mesocestoides corti TaxID=53468 RepID=A0A5K3F059_MESCO
MQVFIFLLALSWRVLAEVPSEEDRKTIMECHTKLREEVKPTASNMQLMSYSREMEQMAQEIFSHCDAEDLKPDPKFQNMGFIVLHSLSDKPQYHDLCKVNSTSYDNKKEDCDLNCLNYRQMVRAKSTQVGCAFGQCITKDDPSTINHLLTCAYKPR